MVPAWITERLLITVRTYPVPATKGIEVSCTAAVSESGKWRRIFPVPYRSLPDDKRFSKYQWIDAQITKASDARPESHHLNIDSIKLGDVVPSSSAWKARRRILKPLMRSSLCAIKKERDEKGCPTLGLFKPGKISRLIVAQGDKDWTPAQKTILSQKMLGFERSPQDELEKIPFDFFYEFACDDAGCKGHTMSCTDWEMGESYRKWRMRYGDGWEAKFRERYERDMIERLDTHFYVGTLHQHPKNWIIVGLFYPPYQEADPQPDLFRPS